MILTGFRAAPGVKTVNGVVYNYIASRYDGYGIFVLLYLDKDGSPKIITWQDYCIKINPSKDFELITGASTVTGASTE